MSDSRVCFGSIAAIASAPGSRTLAKVTYRWIEGQADRTEGRRILGALPQLRRGEGWVWAPGEGVLARVAFPRILTLDSSQTPRREMRAGTAGLLATVDAPALGRALAGLAADGSEEP